MAKAEINTQHTLKFLSTFAINGLHFHNSRFDNYRPEIISAGPKNANSNNSNTAIFASLCPFSFPFCCVNPNDHQYLSSPADHIFGSYSGIRNQELDEQWTVITLAPQRIPREVYGMGCMRPPSTDGAAPMSERFCTEQSRYALVCPTTSLPPPWRGRPGCSARPQDLDPQGYRGEEGQGYR